MRFSQVFFIFTWSVERKLISFDFACLNYFFSLFFFLFLMMMKNHRKLFFLLIMIVACAKEKKKNIERNFTIKTNLTYNCVCRRNFNFLLRYDHLGNLISHKDVIKHFFLSRSLLISLNFALFI